MSDDSLAPQDLGGDDAETVNQPKTIVRSRKDRKRKTKVFKSGYTPQSKQKRNTSPPIDASESLTSRLKHLGISTSSMVTPKKGNSYHSQPDEVKLPLEQNLDGSDIFEMHFVNRQKESLELYNWLLVQNYETKSFMPFLSQLYGSGKTTLVRKFRDVVKHLDGNLVRRCPKLDAAILVEINLATLLPPNASGSIQRYIDTNILRKVYQTIQVLECMHSYDHILEDMYTKSQTLGEFLDVYNQKNELPPLLISFDEIQVLEVHDGQSNHLIQSAQRLIELWSVLIGVLVDKQSRKLFFLLVGNSQPLVLLGRKKRITELKNLEKSPSSSAHIILRALSSDHIEESVKQTVIFSAPLLQILYSYGLQEMDIAYLCKRIYFYTGGIPRLVSRVCLDISQPPKIELKNRDKIDQSFRKPSSFRITSTSAEMYMLNTLEGPLRRVLSYIFTLSALGVTFPDDDVSINKFTSMTEILHALPLYIDKTDDSTENKLIYRVIFPECIIHNIEPALRHLPILNGLQKYASILSSGELLEYLTSNIIMLRIMTMQKVWSANLKWKDVSPCYKQSKHIAEMAVDVNLSEMVFFPKVTTKAKKLDNQDIKEELKTLPWSHDVSIDDWSWLVTNLAKVKYFHKPKPMSQSCDLFFYPTNGIIVGYALKNYGEGTSFTISMLQEEIFKAAMVMKGASIQKFTLFVLSRTQKSLQGLFTSEPICRIDSGRFVWSNNKLSKIDEKKSSLTYFEMKERLKSKETSNNLAVPEGMEVIVLGERAFEEFFGKEVVEVLKDIATHQAIQSTSLSLLRRVIKKGLFTEEVLGPVNQKEKITSRNKISSGYSSSQSIESDASDTQGIIIRYEDDEGDMRRVRVKSLVELKLIIANEWKRDPDHIHKIRYRDGDELVAVKNEHCFKLIPNKTTVIVTWHDL